jgi:hypothetical protein
MKDKNTTWNGLLKTIFATTFSIVLTFGTAALIERQKIEAASGVKENVWETKIPSVRDPWLKAIENTSIQ